MATMLDETELEQRPIPAEVSSRLGSLRSLIRGWFLVEGSSRLVWTAIAMALASFVLDYCFRLDYSQRSFLLVVMVIVLLLSAVARVLRPLGTPVSDDALILEVERRHPELAE